MRNALLPALIIILKPFLGFGPILEHLYDIFLCDFLCDEFYALAVEFLLGLDWGKCCLFASQLLLVVCAL